MTDKQAAVARANADAALARERLSMTLHAVQARLNPRSLAQDVAESVTDKVQDGVAVARRNPGIAAGALAAAGLLLARRPIIRLFRRKRETAVGPVSLATDKQKDFR